MGGKVDLGLGGFSVTIVFWAIPNVTKYTFRYSNTLHYHQKRPNKSKVAWKIFVFWSLVPYKEGG